MTDDHPDVSTANARAGLVLFFIYLAFYAGFMGLAAFAPQAMGRPVLGGVNLAITYGMGLIVGALVVAALYMAACARNAKLRGTGILPVSQTTDASNLPTSGLTTHGQGGLTKHGAGGLTTHGQDGRATDATGILPMSRVGGTGILPVSQTTDASNLPTTGLTTHGQDGLTSHGQDGLTTHGQDGLTSHGQDGLTTHGQDGLTTHGQDGRATEDLP